MFKEELIRNRMEIEQGTIIYNKTMSRSLSSDSIRHRCEIEEFISTIKNLFKTDNINTLKCNFHPMRINLPNQEIGEPLSFMVTGGGTSFTVLPKPEHKYACYIDLNVDNLVKAWLEKHENELNDKNGFILETCKTHRVISLHFLGVDPLA